MNKIVSKRGLFVLLILLLTHNLTGQSLQPYKQYFGQNKIYTNYQNHSEVQVLAPNSSDVVVIIRYNNQNGQVAGHLYIEKGSYGTIQLANGTYQVFFYYGSNWSAYKNMGNNIMGGFQSNEVFSKDNPVSPNNNVLTYELQLQVNGNFNTKSSNKNEVF